jgi:hypothetical protein
MTDTPERTPAEELRAAAKRLRETAKEATPVHGQPYGWDGFSEKHAELGRAVVYGGPGVDGYRTGTVFEFKEWTDCEECVRPTEGDVEWMTLVDPGLAEPLAAWLDAHGRDLEGAGGTLANLSTCDSPADVKHALAVARVLNGGAS